MILFVIVKLVSFICFYFQNGSFNGLQFTTRLRQDLNSKDQQGLDCFIDVSHALTFYMYYSRVRFAKMFPKVLLTKQWAYYLNIAEYCSQSTSNQKMGDKSVKLLMRFWFITSSIASMLQ